MNTTTLCFRALICVAVLAFSTVVGAKELKLGLIVPGDHAWSQAAREMGSGNNPSKHWVATPMFAMGCTWNR